MRRVKRSRGTISPLQNLYQSTVCCSVLPMVGVTNRTAQPIQNKQLIGSPFLRAQADVYEDWAKGVPRDTHHVMTKDDPLSQAGLSGWARWMLLSSLDGFFPGMSLVTSWKRISGEPLSRSLAQSRKVQLRLKLRILST